MKRLYNKPTTDVVTVIQKTSMLIDSGESLPSSLPFPGIGGKAKQRDEASFSSDNMEKDEEELW